MEENIYQKCWFLPTWLNLAEYCILVSPWDSLLSISPDSVKSDGCIPTVHLRAPSMDDTASWWEWRDTVLELEHQSHERHCNNRSLTSAVWTPLRFLLKAVAVSPWSIWEPMSSMGKKASKHTSAVWTPSRFLSKVVAVSLQSIWEPTSSMSDTDSWCKQRESVPENEHHSGKTYITAIESLPLLFGHHPFHKRQQNFLLVCQAPRIAELHDDYEAVKMSWTRWTVTHLLLLHMTKMIQQCWKDDFPFQPLWIEKKSMDTGKKQMYHLYKAIFASDSWHIIKQYLASALPSFSEKKLSHFK